MPEPKWSLARTSQAQDMDPIHMCPSPNKTLSQPSCEDCSTVRPTVRLSDRLPQLSSNAPTVRQCPNCQAMPQHVRQYLNMSGQALQFWVGCVGCGVGWGGEVGGGCGVFYVFMYLMFLCGRGIYLASDFACYPLVWPHYSLEAILPSR